MGVGDAAKIHGDAKEARRPERFRLGREFFQMTAKRLFASVDAEHRLESRSFDLSGLPLRMYGQCVERLHAKAALEGQMKNPPPLEARKALDLGHQFGPSLCDKCDSAGGDQPSTCATWYTRKARCSTVIDCRLGVAAWAAWRRPCKGPR